MNSWLLIRRLRGPAFLLLVGITALLNQWDILSFGRSWPLYLDSLRRYEPGRASRALSGPSRRLRPNHRTAAHAELHHLRR